MISKKNGFPDLIICPRALLENWKREIDNFTNNISSYVHYGNKRINHYKMLQNAANIVIVSYETVVSDRALFMSIHWNHIICDESQYLKNPQSRRRQIISQFSEGQ